MWSNGVKTAFFQKLRKIAQRLGASPSYPHSLRWLGDPPSDPRLWYVSITVHFFTKHVSQFRHFHILTIALSPRPWTSFYLHANTRPLFLIFHSTISLPHKKLLFQSFWWRYCMWFVVCFPPLKSKSLLRLCRRGMCSMFRCFRASEQYAVCQIMKLIWFLVKNLFRTLALAIALLWWLPKILDHRWE